MNEFESAAGEQPLFWLGLTGFAPDQRAAVEASLAREGALPRWGLAPFAEADAWLVNGAKCRVLPGGNLRVMPGLPNEATVNLDMSGVDRPLAFALPLAAPELEPRYLLDLPDRESAQSMLLRFDQHLSFAQARFALGRQVVELGARLRHGIFHVSQREQVLAVLDFRRGEAALSPQLAAAQVHHAEWTRRPDGAPVAPPGFVPCTTSQLAWSYVRRTDRDLLPARYREQPIHYRNTPRVPVRWLRDSQLTLLGELQMQSGTLESLRQRTGLPAERIERDIACLYYAAAVTTTPAKAGSRGAAPGQESAGSAAPESRAPADEPAPATPYRSAPTVAAPLQPAFKRARG
jgi:hypothetical protein